MIPRGPGCQAGHFRQRVRPARTVGDLPHIPVQTQYSRGCAGAYGDCGHCIGEIDVPFRPRARAFLPDAGLPHLPVGIGIGALEPQPAEARHAQVLGPHLYPLRDGEAILPAVPALEARISPRALKEGLVRVRQVFQDVADLAEAVLLQPCVPGITPQGGEFLAQAEEGDAGGLLSFPRLVRRVQAWNSRFPVCEGAVGRLKRLSLSFIIRPPAVGFQGEKPGVPTPLCTASP